MLVAWYADCGENLAFLPSHHLGCWWFAGAGSGWLLVLSWRNSACPAQPLFPQPLKQYFRFADLLLVDSV